MTDSASALEPVASLTHRCLVGTTRRRGATGRGLSFGARILQERSHLCHRTPSYTHEPCLPHLHLRASTRHEWRGWHTAHNVSHAFTGNVNGPFEGGPSRRPEGPQEWPLVPGLQVSCKVTQEHPGCWICVQLVNREGPWWQWCLSMAGWVVEDCQGSPNGLGNSVHMRDPHTESCS